MTRDEAIHYAEGLKNHWTIKLADMEEFCNMAIEALLEKSDDSKSFSDSAETSGDKGGDAEVAVIPEGTGLMQQSPNDGADLISREDAVKAVEKLREKPEKYYTQYNCGVECSIKALSALPTADRPSMIPIKLEKRYPQSKDEDITDAFMRGYMQGKSADRPHGEWGHMIADGDGGSHWYEYECSHCGEIVLRPYNYCPNCGANMEGGDDDGKD